MAIRRFDKQVYDIVYFNPGLTVPELADQFQREFGRMMEGQVTSLRMHISQTIKRLIIKDLVTHTSEGIFPTSKELDEEVVSGRNVSEPLTEEQELRLLLAQVDLKRDRRRAKMTGERLLLENKKEERGRIFFEIGKLTSAIDLGHISSEEGNRNIDELQLRLDELEEHRD